MSLCHEKDYNVVSTGTNVAQIKFSLCLMGYYLYYQVSYVLSHLWINARTSTVLCRVNWPSLLTWRNWVILSSWMMSQNPGRAVLIHPCQAWLHGLWTCCCESKSWRVGRRTFVFQTLFGFLVSSIRSLSLLLLSSPWQERTNGLWTRWHFR